MTILALKQPKKSVLQNIRIASPCPASWEQMAGDDRTRHCTECNLKVYNFSAMTEREIEELLLRSEGRVCGRLYRRKDGTILTQDCPRGLRAAAHRLVRVAGAALSMLMSVGVVAQPPNRDGQQTQTSKDQGSQNETTLNLVVVDYHGLAVPGADVTLKKKFGGKKLHGVTNSSGALNLSNFEHGRYRLVVFSQGQETYRKTVTLEKKRPQDLKVVLRPDEETVTVGGITTQPADEPFGTHTFTSEEINRLM